MVGTRNFAAIFMSVRSEGWTLCQPDETKEGNFDRFMPSVEPRICADRNEDRFLGSLCGNPAAALFSIWLASHSNSKNVRNAGVCEWPLNDMHTLRASTQGLRLKGLNK
jgi:hypothetical protein